MGQGHQCCSKQKVKRGLWSPEEDEKLVGHIRRHGHGCWSSVPRLAGLQRCGKSCRLRWINYLRPDVKRGSFTEQEERTIIEVHRILGNRWAQIAKHLPGRTDNEVKNFWNSCIKKKLLSQGLDPNTHNLLISSSSSDAKLRPNPINSTFTLHHSTSTSTSTSASTANHMHMHMHDDHYSSSDDPLFSSLLNITSHIHNIQQPQHHYHTHTHELAMEDAEYLNYDIPLTQGDFPADFDHFILDSAFISMPPPPLPLPLDHAPLPNSNWDPY